MIVVADTTPLNYLIQLGHVDVLREFYGRVLVPHAVLMEMQHAEAPPEVHAWALGPPEWLERVEVRQLDASLPAELGDGEREAISLALEVKADALLIDEWAWRREATARHLEIAGTLAILLRASLRGYLAFPEALDRLRQCGFRMSKSVEAAMLAYYNQQSQGS